MFNLYEYIETIRTDVPAIGKAYPVTSIVQIESLLSDLRNTPPVAALVRESPSGQLNFDERRLDTSYESFYVMCKASVNDHASRMLAKRQAKAIGIQLIDRMRSDKPGYGSPFYGFRPANVQYDEIGPLGKNYFGYHFTFTVDQGFGLVSHIPNFGLIAALEIGVSPNNVGYGYDAEWFGSLSPNKINDSTITILGYNTNENRLIINAAGLFSGKDQGADVINVKINQIDLKLKKINDNSAYLILQENPFSAVGEIITVHLQLL